jgi:hypothetical protein
VAFLVVKVDRGRRRVDGAFSEANGRDGWRAAPALLLADDPFAPKNEPALAGGERSLGSACFVGVMCGSA